MVIRSQLINYLELPSIFGLVLSSPPAGNPSCWQAPLNSGTGVSQLAKLNVFWVTKGSKSLSSLTTHGWKCGWGGEVKGRVQVIYWWQIGTHSIMNCYKADKKTLEWALLHETMWERHGKNGECPKEGHPYDLGAEAHGILGGVKSLLRWVGSGGGGRVLLPAAKRVVGEESESPSSWKCTG